MKIRNLLLTVVLLLVAMFTSAFVPAQATPPTGGEVPAAVQLLIPVLVGAIGVPLVNQLKSWLKLSNPIQNLWITFAVSASLAFVALWMSNLILPMTTPQDYIKFLGVIFSTATLIYKSFPGQTEPTTNPNPEAETKASKQTPDGASVAESKQR